MPAASDIVTTARACPTRHCGQVDDRRRDGARRRRRSHAFLWKTAVAVRTSRSGDSGAKPVRKGGFVLPISAEFSLASAGARRKDGGGPHRPHTAACASRLSVRTPGISTSGSRWAASSTATGLRRTVQPSHRWVFNRGLNRGGPQSCSALDVPRRRDIGLGNAHRGRGAAGSATISWLPMPLAGSLGELADDAGTSRALGRHRDDHTSRELDAIVWADDVVADERPVMLARDAPRADFSASPTSAKVRRC